jgi:hypothetical protein
MPDMTKHEYQFMMNAWEGPKGAAYNAVYEFCRGFGWMLGFTNDGLVIQSNEGAKAVRQYQKEGWKKLDVV